MFFITLDWKACFQSFYILHEEPSQNNTKYVFVKCIYSKSFRVVWYVFMSTGIYVNNWKSLTGVPANSVACWLYFSLSYFKEPQLEPLLGERIVFWPIF